MFHRALSSLAACGLVFALASCSPTPKPECLPDRDNWSHQPGYTLSDYAGGDQDIRYKLWSAVRPEKMDDAIARLAHAKDGYIALTDAEAASFATSVPDGTDEMVPYLVRALSSHEASGAYHVDYYKSQLWVRYQIADLKVCKPSSFHEGVVVWLAQPPSEVSVSISFVEK